MKIKWVNLIMGAFLSCGSFSALADDSVKSAENGTPAAKVYFTRDISPAGLLKLYSKVNEDITGKVIIKFHTGEPNGPNLLPKDMVKALYDSVPDAALGDTNTLYKGMRYTTAQHRQTIHVNGWDSFAKVDILDEEGTVNFPVKGGKRFKEVSMGGHLANYDSMIVLTHFKGHAMGGFGGSIKNIAIGCADGRIGKKQVHAAPDNDDYSAWLMGKEFMENMVESAKATVDHFSPHITYINVLRRMSVDCDCAGTRAAEPTARDIGILASKDILAVDQASIDMVYT
ncbi:MAG: DUF362 domain-containing protein [Succinivibrionaceae bacterium]|nr:DUF362 domain-containing protein [Succinivibrionaceae bacterium]